MKIFYSWQSDLENKYNRGFIKDVLEHVIKRLNTGLRIDEPERQIELDHDTKNVSGMPDLAGTIFEKITNSTIFIADISFVAESKSTPPRKVPNPNVLIELGHALSSLGSDRVICVMNTITGSAEELPFDLRHKRHPIQYSFNEDSDKTSQKEQLISTLSAAIRPIIDLQKYRKKELSLTANPSREEIFEVIMASDSKDDWERLAFNWQETIYFKKNVNLRFESEPNEELIQKDFKAPWANSFLDQNATGYWHHLFYASTHIGKYKLVSVDGGRALLPLPNDRTSLVVNPLFYKVAQIHDSLGSLDEYMNMSGLRLENI